MMRENEHNDGKKEQMDVIDLIINCLREHEGKFDQLLGRLEKKTDEVDSGKLRNYGSIFIEDKRGTHSVNYGQVIKTAYGINGLEMSTDKGYTICFSDSGNPHKKEHS